MIDHIDSSEYKCKYKYYMTIFESNNILYNNKSLTIEADELYEQL